MIEEDNRQKDETDGAFPARSGQECRHRLLRALGIDRNPQASRGGSW